jgi:regulator of sigma E protease
VGPPYDYKPDRGPGELIETILSTVVLLSVLILVHELGHFFAAKSVDIEVQRFSLGMGPRVAGFRIGETDFVLSALPIGGYVSMAGMTGDEAAGTLEGGAAAPSGPSPRDFDAKPLWARIWVVSAGVLMNFLFAALVFAAIPFIWGEQLSPNRQVVVRDGVALPRGAEPLAQVPFGAEVVGVNGRTVETWNDFSRALIDAGSGSVTLRFADAPPVTFTMPTQDSLRVVVFNAIQPLYEPVLGRVLPGTPAAEAGLQPGDRILSVDGQPMRTWWDFQEVIRTRPGEPLNLSIQRDEDIRQVTVTPALERDVARGEQVGRVGIAPHVETIHRTMGLTASLERGFTDTWRYSTTIVAFLGNLITGQESPRQVGSLLTIGQLSGEFARAGLEVFMWWMAVFSVNLAVLNLLPIPILDGGHLMFMSIEAIRGRPLSIEQRVRLSHVGLIIVVGIMVWALTNDVLRVFGI